MKKTGPERDFLGTILNGQGKVTRGQSYHLPLLAAKRPENKVSTWRRNLYRCISDPISPRVFKKLPTSKLPNYRTFRSSVAGAKLGMAVTALAHRSSPEWRSQSCRLGRPFTKGAEAPLPGLGKTLSSFSNTRRETGIPSVLEKLEKIANISSIDKSHKHFGLYQLLLDKQLLLTAYANLLGRYSTELFYAEGIYNRPRIPGASLRSAPI